MDQHYDDDDRDAGWGFTQVALASRSPLRQLYGNVSPRFTLHGRPGEKAHAVSQPIVVYDVSDGEDEEQEPEAEAAEVLPCITQLYDEEEEAPCLVEDEGDAAPGDVPHGYAAGGPCSLSAHNNRRSRQFGVCAFSHAATRPPRTSATWSHLQTATSRQYGLR
jgi:hypothetical protein